MSKTYETVEEATARIAELETEVDEWKGHSRTWEQRAKDNKAAAEERDALKTRVGELEAERDSGKTEVEQRLEKLQNDLKAEQDARKADQEARAAAELKSTRLRIGTEKGLPPALIDRLGGEDEESITADADKLLEALPKGDGTTFPDLGQGVGGGKKLTPDEAAALPLDQYEQAVKDGRI